MNKCCLLPGLLSRFPRRRNAPNREAGREDRSLAHSTATSGIGTLREAEIEKLIDQEAWDEVVDMASAV